MQDAHVGLGGLELIRREDIAVAQAQIVLFVEKALALDGGIAKDDMTAFCVRIFEKAS